MIKSVTTGLCVLALSGTIALAQSSQGQAGANTSPTSPSPIAQKAQPDPMNSNAKMKKHKMKKHSMKKDMGDKGGMSGGMSK